LKDKIFRFLLNERNTKAIIGISSFFFYIIGSNILNNLLCLIFKVQPKFIIVASYCKIGLPQGSLNGAFNRALILVSLKFLILALSVFYRKKISTYKFGRIGLLLIVCFTCIELYSFSFFVFDRLFNTTSFRYFVSATYLYVSANQINLFYPLIVIHISIMFLASFFISTRLNQLYKNTIVNCMSFSAISILLLIVIHFVFRLIIN